MPKRAAPIVPLSSGSTSAPPKKAKKALKKARAEGQLWPAMAGPDGSYPQVDDSPPGGAANASDNAAADGEEEQLVDCKLVTIQHDAPDSFQAVAASVRAASILAEPDKPDKPARFLEWLLAPLDPKQFLAESFGKHPVLISRDETRRDHFHGVFSMSELERQVRDCSLRWTDHVDAARYTEAGGRTTHNGEGVATPADVWAKYKSGCSIRLSWPQHHGDALWGVIEQLESFFGSGGGANVYATPANAQGFAPHWDDIDAFVMQLEGSKTWRVYAPRTAHEALPRFSSPNLKPDELGALLGEVTLRPGDLLYLPRGIVHQATCGAEASLHVTCSVGRQHAWRDLMEVGVLGALEAAAMRFPEWRETLPVDMVDHMGIVHVESDEVADDEADESAATGGGRGGGGNDDDDDDDDETAAASSAPSGASARRAAISMRLRTMLRQLVDSMPLDDMVDQFVCQRFLFDRMPPRLSSHDASRRLTDPSVVTLDSKIRLTSARVARLAIEDGVAAFYFSSHNTRTFHGHEEPQHIDFAIESAPALEVILNSYPKYVTVARLPADSDAQRLDIARACVEAKAVLIKPEPKDQAKIKAAAAAATAAAEAAGWDISGEGGGAAHKKKKKKKKTAPSEDEE